MEFINICQKKFYKGKVHSSSSCENDSTSAEKILSDEGFWCTKKRSAGIKEFVVIDFEKESAIDYIKITASSNGASAFPSAFRLEGSNDAEIWSVLYSETNTSLDSSVHDVHLPLTVIRYLKVLITDPAVLGSNYYSEIGKVEAGIFGVEEIKASSYTEGHSPENLLADNSTFWETEQAASGTMENVSIDLGKSAALTELCWFHQ
jgi:hypothetical protein